MPSHYCTAAAIQLKKTFFSTPTHTHKDDGWQIATFWSTKFFFQFLCIFVQGRSCWRGHPQHSETLARVCTYRSLKVRTDIKKTKATLLPYNVFIPWKITMLWKTMSVCKLLANVVYHVLRWKSFCGCFQIDVRSGPQFLCENEQQAFCLENEALFGGFLLH